MKKLSDKDVLERLYVMIKDLQNERSIDGRILRSGYEELGRLTYSLMREIYQSLNEVDYE